jgi:hypothetical protein
METKKLVTGFTIQNLVGISTKCFFITDINTTEATPYVFRNFVFHNRLSSLFCGSYYINVKDTEEKKIVFFEICH